MVHETLHTTEYCMSISYNVTRLLLLLWVHAGICFSTAVAISSFTCFPAAYRFYCKCSDHFGNNSLNIYNCQSKINCFRNPSVLQNHCYSDNKKSLISKVWFGRSNFNINRKNRHFDDSFCIILYREERISATFGIMEISRTVVSYSFLPSKN